MIALSVNQYVWGELKKDATLNAKYAKYRTKYGNNFIPFFPVADNNAGDISWGSEPYVLYDSMTMPPTRNIYMSQREQIVYTIVGTIPELFTFKNKVTALFNHWENTSMTLDGYRIIDIDAWSSDRTRVRDKVRQTYSLTLMLEVHYIPC